MGRKRVYADGAERQRAYRERHAATRSSPTRPSPPITRAKRPLSRPARFDRLLAELENLAAEYEDWQAALPEAFQGSTLADKLSQAVEQLNAAKDLLSDVDLPRGFGRD